MSNTESIIDKLFREGKEQIESGAATKMLNEMAKAKDAEAKRAASANDDQIERALSEIEDEYAPTVPGGM